MSLFPQLESAGNVEGIHNLLNLCKLISSAFYVGVSVVDLGYDDVVDLIFSEDCYETLFGLMECAHSRILSLLDRPGLPSKGDYRNYFKTHVHFRNTMSELDASFLSLIHKLYRLIFFRDAVDPQPIEDIIPSSLSTLIAQTIDSLIRKVCTSEPFLKEVVDGLESDKAHLSLCVLKELCGYCKSLSAGSREALIVYVVLQ